MKKIVLLGCSAATLAVAVTAYGLQMNIPTTVENGIDVFSGPSFTVSGNFGLSDFISVEAIGTVDLNFGNFTANAAGVITAPPVTNTGNNPGQTAPALPGVARTPVRRRGCRHHGNRVPRRLERKGQA